MKLPYLDPTSNISHISLPEDGLYPGLRFTSVMISDDLGHFMDT